MIQNPSGQDLLTLREAMAEVGVTRRTLYCWMNKHLIEFIRLPGGQRRIVRDSLWKGREKRQTKQETNAHRR